MRCLFQSLLPCFNFIPVNHTKIEAAIIDLDGTMVDTMGDFVVAINLMLHDLGYPPVDRNVVAVRVGKGSEHLVKSVLNHIESQLIRAQAAPDNIAKFESALDVYQQHYHAINGQNAQVYAGVFDGLAALQKAGLKLACLTNKPVDFARELLRLKGLDGFFSHVFGGDSFAAKKPDALPVLKTCEALSTLPGQTLMVGDSSNDALAARAAGCPVMLVSYGYNHDVPIQQVNADGYVDTLSDVLRACEAITALTGEATLN